PMPNRAKLGVAVSNKAAPAPISHLRRLVRVSMTFIKPPAVGLNYMHCGQVGSNLSRENVWICVGFVMVSVDWRQIHASVLLPVAVPTNRRASRMAAMIPET